MPDIPITELGQYGLAIAPDRYPHRLPLNAWSAGSNVRFRDGLVEKMLGHQVAWTPSVAPYFALPINIAGVYYWIYAGLTKIYEYDGGSHVNITRQSAGVDVNYTATAIRNWTGGRLGPVAIFNNGLDVPQFWLGTGKMADLTNWPATYRAGAMRVFRRFLVAMDINKAGTPCPQMVKWSHPAASGAVPTSWNEADATKDAGEYEILDTDGAVVDGAPLRGAFVIYKEDAVHLMEFVGGVDIFKFTPLFDSFGILSRRCAAEYSKGRHAVFALGDLISHDGQTWQSIVNGRMRKWLFQQIDSSNYQKCFIALNPSFYEVWFCFPSTGNTTPNMAVVWNWQQNTVGVREIAASHIATGNVTLLSTGDIWDNDSGAWDSDPSAWDEGTFNPSGKRLLLLDSANTKVYQGDATNQFAGVSMTAYVERTGLGYPLKVDSPPDFTTRKFIAELWPHIAGTIGGVVNISLGTQEVIDGPVTWLPSRPFTIGTSKMLDFRVNAPLFAIKFQSTTDLDWKLTSYDINVVPAGR